MSAWPEEVVAVKQLQDYVDLERRVELMSHRCTIVDNNLKNKYFTGNAPANHTNGTFAPGSLWFITIDVKEN